MVSSRRIVCTGLGLVSPLRKNTQETFEDLCRGKSFISKIDSERFRHFPVRVGGVIKDIAHFRGNDTENRFYSRGTNLLLHATHEAVNQSEWFPSSETCMRRTFVVVGTGICESIIYKEAIDRSLLTGSSNTNFIPLSLMNTPNYAISKAFNAKGASVSLNASSATGLSAVGNAYKMLKHGDFDVGIVGSYDTPIDPVMFSSLLSLKALARNYNDDPESASKPFDRDRCGLVVSEAAGVLILEEYEHARNRGAKILAEICGFKDYTDSCSYFSPNPKVDLKVFVMRECLAEAGMTASDIKYINCHATSTIKGDRNELDSISQLFGNSKAKLSSNKGSTGHCFSASGSIEVIFSICSMLENKIPPNKNLRILDSPENIKENVISDSCYTFHDSECDTVLKNAYGFGGITSSMCLRKLH